MSFGPLVVQLSGDSELAKYYYVAIVIKFFNNLIHVVAHLFMMLY